MSPTAFLITKLTRVDPATVRRAISTARSQDEPDAPPPAEFATGPGAMVYAMAVFAFRRPLQFYVGLFGLAVFPVYLLARLAEHFYGR
jgi:hypothetical protein